MQAKYAHLLIITECKNTKKEKIAKKMVEGMPKKRTFAAKF